MVGPWRWRGGGGVVTMAMEGGGDGWVVVMAMEGGGDGGVVAVVAGW